MSSVKTSYVRLMVTTKETPVVDTQKIMIKDSKNMPQKVFKSQRKTAREEARNKGPTKQSENNRISILVSPYL